MTLPQAPTQMLETLAWPQALAALVGLIFAASSCQMGDGSCLRMSDCDRGYVCVEGTCLSDSARADGPGAQPASPSVGTDGGLEAADGGLDVGDGAASSGAPGDAATSSEGAVDAASDAK